ncbi:MAG: hypothetical protein WCO82_11770 [Sphingomonadales bacterium]|jgi:hypothetical protein
MFSKLLGRPLAALATALGVALLAPPLLTPATAGTYQWQVDVWGLSSGFNGPATYLGQTLGSGTFTTSRSATSVALDTGFGFTVPARLHDITSFTGTIAGATITGLVPTGSSMDYATIVGMGSFTADNTLAILGGGNIRLAPMGVLALKLDSLVDAGTVHTYWGETLSVPGNRLSLFNDDFGAFVQTQRSNEWQGSLSISNLSVPEPAIWAELIAGFALAGLMARRRLPWFNPA